MKTSGPAELRKRPLEALSRLDAPRQSAPVQRDRARIAAFHLDGVSQSGCCQYVLGVCVLESPVCFG
jgi:hypothetical protein